MRKTRVGILFGGKSAEHEVSLQSAKNIIEAIDKTKYDLVLIGIDKEGRWQLTDSSRYLLDAQNPKLIKLNRASGNSMAIIPGKTEDQLVAVSDSPTPERVDVIFPVLHGPFGEDGTIQGMLKLAGIPFVGAGVLGSAVGMDKDVMKRLLRDAGIPTAKFVTLYRHNRNCISFEQVQESLGSPMFVKPANLGSSVGISKVRNPEEYSKALEIAFSFDNKVVIEEAISGREIEVSVLGNENAVASIPGEIITDPKHEFYSYDAKYIDENGALLEVPARLSEPLIAEFQKMAIRTFRTVECEGMARVDFFLVDNKTILVNELNTIPGFTKISMYPRLWEASGIPYPELIDRLIQLALERHARDRNIRVSYEPE
jgi:D-alanine-D-alanine ligase